MKHDALQQRVIQRLGGACWEYDLVDERVTCSEEFLALLGYAPEERRFDLDWVTDSIHSKDLPRWREAFVKSIKGQNKFFDCETRFRHKHNFYIWIQTRGLVTQRDSDGRARQIIGLAFDISERKAFNESEARFRLFLDNIPVALSLKNQQGRYLYINREFEKWLQKPSYKIQGKTVDELFLPETSALDELREHEREVWDKGEAISKERLFPLTGDRRYRYAVITKFPVFDDTGEMFGIGTVNTDVTERYHARQALSASERRYRRLFELAPVVLSETDWSRGKILVDALRARGITNIKKHLIDHPELIRRQSEVMRLLSVNQEALRVYGAASEDQLIEYAARELGGEQRLSLIEELASLADGQRRSVRHTSDCRIDGARFPIIRILELFSEDQDDWSQVLLTVRDASAEEAVRLSEELYRRLFELAPAVLMESDWSKGKALIDRLRAAGVTNIKQHLIEHPHLLRSQSEVMKVLNVNREALRIYKTENVQALISRTELEMTESQRRAFAEDLANFANGQNRSVVRSRTLRDNGEEFAIIAESECYGDDPDDWSKVMLTVRDISYEETVRMSELRYRRLFESAPVALYESDWSRGKKLCEDIIQQGFDSVGQYLLDHPNLLRRRDEVMRILDCNSEALKIYQARSKEDLIQSIEGEMNQEQRLSLIKVLDIFASGRRRSSVRSWSRRASGETFPIVRDSELVSGHRDDWSRVLSSIHDLSAEVEAANQLREYQQELRSLAGKISLAEEGERRRISSELHDGTIQNLVLSRIHLANLENLLDSEPAKDLVDRINQLLDSSLQETRSLIFEISPPVLYELGLEPAVEWLAEHYQQRAGITVRINNDGGESRLSDEMKIVMFQTARELLINVVKHAQAGQVSIDWRHLDASVEMKVGDDGIGFDIHSIQEQRATEGGFGLFSVRERLKLLGAEIDIQSSSRGTSVTIMAPTHTH